MPAKTDAERVDELTAAVDRAVQTLDELLPQLQAVRAFAGVANRLRLTRHDLFARLVDVTKTQQINLNGLPSPPDPEE